MSEAPEEIVNNPPHILELRIHGINNTPPEVLLGVERDDVESVGSDALGGFWKYRTKPQRKSAGGTHHGKLRTDRDPRIRTEAYSWGNMVRSGGSLGSKLLSVLIQIGWFLTLPFALCNVAYWTRAIVRKGAPDREWLAGAGVGTVRLFGLGLTLLLTSALSTVMLDLLGTQCFRDTAMCGGLPDFFQMLPQGNEGRSQRLVILSLGVVAVMLLLSFITHSTSVRYETDARVFGENLDEGTADSGGKLNAHVADTSAPPILGTAGFWSRTRVGQTSETVHLAAVLALLSGFLAWDRAFAAAQQCQSARELVRCQPDEVLKTYPLEFATVIVAVIVVAACVALTLVSTARSQGWVKWGRGIGIGIVVAAGALYAFEVGRVGLKVGDAVVPTSTEQVSSFLGLTVLPTVLVALLTAGCVAALTWRMAPKIGGWLGLIPLLLALLIMGGSLGMFADPNGAVISGAIFLGLFIAAAVIMGLVGNRYRFEAWQGFGPFVALALSLTAALLLTCIMVFSARLMLLPAAGPLEDSSSWKPFKNAPKNEAWPEQLALPAIYELFGAALVAIVGLLIFIVGIAALRQWWSRYRRLSTPRLRWPRGASARQKGIDAILLPGTIGEDYPASNSLGASDASLASNKRAVRGARRFAAFAQRGEPLAGFLAVASIAVIGGSLAYSLLSTDGNLSDTDQGLASLVDSMLVPTFTVMLIIAAAAVVLVIGNTASKDERPLGLLWDIMCFFPRAGHPFSPPSYGERAIPELTKRAGDWLGEEPNDRKVVLSAHSMGAVLAVATILALHGHTGVQQAHRFGRLGLLTFGIQLRPYFARLFPDVLGDQVLGIPPTVASSPLARDPWHRQIKREWGKRKTPPKPWLEPDSHSVASYLTVSGRSIPAWVNLWRRTDYLGFPVYSYLDDENPIDRGATETDPTTYLWSVARHSGYQSTLQYQAALDEVIDRLNAP